MTSPNDANDSIRSRAYAWLMRTAYPSVRTPLQKKRAGFWIGVIVTGWIGIRILRENIAARDLAPFPSVLALGAVVALLYPAWNSSYGPGSRDVDA